MQSYQRFTCESNKYYQLDNVYDIVEFWYLEIPKNIKLKSIRQIKILINHTVIWNIEFSLLRKLSDPDNKIENKHLIMFNDILGIETIFPDAIPDLKHAIPSLKHGIPISKIKGDIQFILESDKNFEYHLSVYDTYCKPEIKAELVKQRICQIINQTYSYEFKSRDNTSWHSTNTKCCGFYVESTKIRSIIFDNENEILFQHRDKQMKKYVMHQKKKWTKTHALTLFEIFREIFPDDIINIINKYCKMINPSKYLYYFPLYAKECTYPNNIGIDLINNKLAIKIFGDEPVKITITTKQVLDYGPC